jgi:hypothetical protein
MTLDMRSACESCGIALTPDGLAFICSYECTFCEACSGAKGYRCPNCRGLLVLRPRRAVDAPSCEAQGLPKITEERGAPLAVLLRRFEKPDEIREFNKGRFEVVRIGGMSIGRATYQPGWRWSADVGAKLGASHCTVEHVGLVLEGAATAALDGAEVITMRAGQLFFIPSTPHDSWVVGDAAYVSLHFMGAEQFAR